MTGLNAWRPPAARNRGRALTLAIFALAIAGGILGLLIGRWMSDRPMTASVDVTNSVAPLVKTLEPPRQLTDFALVDGTGQPFGRSALSGRWSLMFFGFTHCPDVCPITLATLAQARRLLSAETDLQIVFVTVDPARDDEETVREYAGRFHPDIIGVTGPEPQIKAIAMQLGVQYTQPPQAGPHAGHYQIDHTTSLALIDPEARLFGMLPEAVDAGALASALQATIESP